MIRFLLPAIQLALLVYCLIECIQSDEGSVRNLSKIWWILLIIFVPIVGPVAWLVAGRPTTTAAGRTVPWPATRTAGFPEYERPRPPRGPDDDPAFLAGVGGPDPEHEYLLRQWEAQLREREEKLRGASQGGQVPEPDAGTEPEESGRQPD